MGFPTPLFPNLFNEFYIKNQKKGGLFVIQSSEQIYIDYFEWNISPKYIYIMVGSQQVNE